MIVIIFEARRRDELVLTSSSIESERPAFEEQLREQAVVTHDRDGNVFGLEGSSASEVTSETVQEAFMVTG